MTESSIHRNMPTGLHGQNSAADPPTSSEDQQGQDSAPRRVHSRSPHPYHRRKPDVFSAAGESPTFASGSSTVVYNRLNPENIGSDGKESPRRVYVISPSESGTEADDERYLIIKALPAPPFRPRKGLRNSKGATNGDITPLLSPEGLDGNSSRSSHGEDHASVVNQPATETEDARVAQAKAVRRRRAEIVRRICEIVFLALLETIVLVKQRVWWSLSRVERAAVVSHAMVVAITALLYPVRLVIYSWRRTTPKKSIWRCIRVSAAFDPAPYAYPTFLPVMTALSLYQSSPRFLMANIILGLSAIPQHLTSTGFDTPYSMVPWLLSISPVIFAERLVGVNCSSTSDATSGSVCQRFPPREVAVSLFPLHQVLVPFVHSFTTTSLLPAELQLLSVSLINLLLFSSSPYSRILATILWVGGLGVYILCAPVVKWGVALARIPRWRLRRAGRIVQARDSFIASLNKRLKEKVSGRQKREIVDSDADDDDVTTERPGLGLESLKLEVLNALRQNIFPAEDEETRSAAEQPDTLSYAMEQAADRKRKRRNTLPTARPQDRVERPKRKRPRSSIANYFLSLTPEQAVIRKWLYAGMLYVVMITLVLVPIRMIISRLALERAEPFGWAIGYLFGDLREVRFWIVSSNLERWIPLPPLEDSGVQKQLEDLGLANFIRQAVVGAANTRLAICAYCVGILMIGMATLLRLTSLVEVDTRRKLFHGMMVAMMLPTIYMDPTFIALALVLMLALFLIFDLLRASQLPPLSKPLAYFLTPYVDGRDLRGPVVISHIFLLIGCAIPLWLSLAGTGMSGESPWRGWEAEFRDVSMVAGVVCVGMGDAAASLIGRRYGRHKWLWSGGKSLEGSVAFAVAVTIGLGFGKIWLAVGGWKEPQQQRSQGEWMSSLTKIGFSACGASFNEAVLTGGNDNVVVPVVLWLLVRSLGV